jgi:hypothetical protein
VEVLKGLGRRGGKENDREWKISKYITSVGRWHNKMHQILLNYY